MNSKTVFWVFCVLFSVTAANNAFTAADDAQKDLVNRTLTVHSLNPNSGVDIAIDRVDVYTHSSGTTPFTRTYANFTFLELTAPPMAGNMYFQKWQKNGVDMTTNNVATLLMTDEFTVTAVYGAGYSADAFQLSVTSPSDYGTVSPGSTITVFWKAEGYPYNIYDVGCTVELFVIDRPSGASHLIQIFSTFFYPGNNASATCNWMVNRPPGTYRLGAKFLTYNGLNWQVPIIHWGFSSDFTITDPQASQKHTLVVKSESPASDVAIGVSPDDANHYGDGITQFARTYLDQTPVTLTAPSMSGTRSFLKWQLLGGVDYSTSQSIHFVMDGDKTFTAVFAPLSQNRRQYQARKMTSPQSVPVIDGNLNDAAWAGVTEAVLERGGKNDAFSTPWTAFADNRVTWKAVWSEETNKLYVAIQVIDDVRGAADNDYDTSDYQPWLDDSIELYTDGDGEGGPYSYETAQQWRITTKNRKNLYNFPIDGTHSYSGDDCITAVTSGADGNWNCEIEMAVYDHFNGARKDLEENDSMGWDVWYNDSDNKTLNGSFYTRDCQTGWWYTGPAWENADYFGILTLGGSTGFESRRGTVPAENAVYQNYPNPFNPGTSIKYLVHERCLVVLKVFDVLGSEVATLVNGWFEPGTYEARFTAAHLPSGIYFYRIQTGEFTALRKMILVE